MDNLNENWEQMIYPFSGSKLSYALTALEPHIDAKTMITHFEKHLGEGVINLNKYLEHYPDLQSMTLNELINYAEVNNELNLLNLAGNVFNHCFFFSSLRPATGQIIIGITPQATQKVNEFFGGWKAMKEQIASQALKLVGSGYIWIVKEPNGALKIMVTKNQTPIKSDLKPVLCIDMWEHAYYLKHQNNQKNYLDAFWNVVDWVKFSNRI